MAMTVIRGGRRSPQADNEELPSYVAPAYDEMEKRWKICRDVDTGTEAVRLDSNLDAYLPKGPAETEAERTLRANRTELYPMFKETVKGLVGLALRKDPILSKDVPAGIVSLAENIDGAGTALPVFTRRVFADAVKKGHSGVLIDVPKVTSTKPLTIRQERDLGLRPYWVHIKPEQTINWRTQVINGITTLVLLVICETVDVPSGRFGTNAVARYRVFIRDEATGLINYEVWTQTEEGKDPEMDTGGFGILQGVTRIPFVVCYAGERLAPLQSMPPLIDLAYTNIAHFQVLSDHRSAIHAASNPILVTKGRTVTPPLGRDPNAPGQSEQNPAIPGQTPTAPPIVLGTSMGIDVGKDGDAKYIEHAGNAISGSRAELIDIQTRGAAQGLAMLQRDTRAAQTAETERLQRNEKDASLSNAVRSLKDMLETGLAFTALFMGETSGGSIEIDMTFEDTLLDTQRITAYSQMVGAGQLTLRTFWSLLIKGGVLPDDFDMDKEEDALAGANAVKLVTTTPAGSDGGGGGPTGGSTAGSDTGSGNPERQRAA